MAKILAQKNFIRNALITIYILVVLGISATAKSETTIEPQSKRANGQQLELEVMKLRKYKSESVAQNSSSLDPLPGIERQLPKVSVLVVF